MSDLFSSYGSTTSETMSVDQDSDEQLIRAAREGDSEAFGVLVERHQRRVVGHLRRLIGEADAADIGQETFIRAWQRLTLYDPRYQFISWLLIIATRLASNHRRRPSMTRLSNEDCDAAQQTGISENDQNDNREAARSHIARLELVLAGLPTEARTLYELRFRQELSITELVAFFGINESAIKVRVHRLRQTLQEALEGIHEH